MGTVYVYIFKLKTLPFFFPLFLELRKEASDLLYRDIEIWG